MSIEELLSIHQWYVIYSEFDFLILCCMQKGMQMNCTNIFVFRYMWYWWAMLPWSGLQHIWDTHFMWPMPTWFRWNRHFMCANFSEQHQILLVCIWNMHLNCYTAKHNCPNRGLSLFTFQASLTDLDPSLTSIWTNVVHHCTKASHYICLRTRTLWNGVGLYAMSASTSYWSVQG